MSSVLPRGRPISAAEAERLVPASGKGEPSMRPTPAFGVAALATSMAAAQPYSIDPFTVDGGGGTLTGTTYSLSGTIGQPDAGVLVGTSFSVQGGFWMSAGEGGCNAADLVEPFGVLDLNDINAFVGAFVAGSPAGDLNNDGVLDLTDINLFVSAFLAGCP
jgi:hypothetical protein